ncbi:MAG TPA: hypothetical protein ENJ16_00350, partial [Planctomycetaceae bacterium]|nr:hypothetical protein [Planctomycetaceae bacterium]
MAPRWMVDSWKWFARARKLQQAEAPRTAGYQSFVSTVWGRQPRDLPPFTLRTAQQMLFDPAVCLGLQMRAAPVCNVEIAYKEGQDWVPGVRAESDDVAEFVKAQVHRIWMHITALLPAQTFGWSAGEVTYRLVDGRLEIDELLPAHTIDTKALVQNGRVVGTRVLNVKGKECGYVDLFFPKSWFHVFDRQPGQIYGLPVLLGAYSPWYDKWMQGGALDVRRMFMHKDAYGGTDITYPEGTTYIPDRGEVPNRDIARELVEQIVAGGVTARPAAYDESGHELWQLSRATVPTNPEHILRYPRDLDVEIWRGLGIADDVLSSESTGAWAGKRIPLAAFLNGLDIWVSAMLQDLTKQILQPLVLANFGDVRFEVQHKPLAEQGMEQQGETQGGSPGGPASPAQGASARMSLDPVEAVGRGVLSAAELVKAARQVLRMGGARAPKGGITIGGKHFVGGQFIPEEVLNAASEEERVALRDAGEGGQPTGDRRQPGIGFASPNKSDDEMTVREAFAALNSERHKRMKRAFQRIDEALGLGYRQIDIVGDWGGAENSVLIEYDQYQDYDELRYAM